MRRLSVFPPLLLLAACAAEVPFEEPGAVRVEVQEMNVGFDYREQLTLRASQDEALLSGPTTGMQVQTLPYAEKESAASDQVLPAWALPRDVAKQVFEQRSCGPLKSARVHLPVDTSKPLRCDMVLDVADRPVVWMVGLGRPFQDVPFLQSSFMVLEEDRYQLFYYVQPFPESDATAQWLHDTFPERHPKMSALVWPNKSFMLLVDDVEKALSQQINPSSAEVQAAMDALKELALSVAPARPTVSR